MIPKLVIEALESKTFKVLFLVVWLLSLLWTADRSWVNESWEKIDNVVVHKENYFDLDRRPVFVALTIVLLGYLFHQFREKSQAYFGLVELIFGFLGAYITLYKLPLSILETWLALAGALYLTIGGLKNMKESSS